VRQLCTGDRIVVRNQELIPVDATLVAGRTHIDYSFVTGEAAPVSKLAGDLVYAGARQLEGSAEYSVMKPVSQSYLTQLWNTDSHTRSGERAHKSFVEKVNRYFTTCVLTLAAGTFLGWCFISPAIAVNAATAILIVACPCTLQGDYLWIVRSHCRNFRPRHRVCNFAADNLHHFRNPDPHAYVIPAVAFFFNRGLSRYSGKFYKKTIHRPVGLRNPDELTRHWHAQRFPALWVGVHSALGFRGGRR
jgi:hypothetical protein